MSTEFRTLNDIIRAFQDIGERHLQIKTFFVGQDFDLGNDTARNSILAVNPISAVLPKTDGGYTSYAVDFTVKVLDLVNKDMSNELEVMSDGLEILKDIVSELNTHPYYIESSFDIIGDVSFEPARGVFDSDLTGWECTFTLEAPNYRYFCGLPMDALNGQTYYPDLFSNIRNSDDTYNTTVIVSETLTLPDITHTDSDLTPVTLPAQTPMVCTPGGGGDATEIIDDSDGNTLYTNVIPAGTTETQVITDSTVDNSNSSYSVNVLAQGALVLPDINLTDSDGTTTAVPSMEDLVCTPAISPSGIAYDRPILTGQTTSYRTGDDAWSLANGVYDYTPPVYPVSYAALDTTHATPFTNLLDNNAFGNKDRFTDDAGGQTYTSVYVIDHLTGLGWVNVLSANANWDASIDAANNATAFGFSDWRLANTFELGSICNEGLNDTLNYAPFSSGKLAQAAYAYTSTTNGGDSTQAYILYSKFSATRSKILSQIAKTVSTKRYLVRNHYT